MILVVSYATEDHTTEVVRRLEAQGREVCLMDLGDFPARAELALSWGNGEPPSYRASTSKGRADLRRARAGWWRRVRPFEAAPGVRSRARVFAESETSQAVFGMLDSLSCPWINPRLPDEAAHHKPSQWAVAHQVGLRLPRTLVTNEPQAARRFIQQVGVGRTVFKAFLASTEDWRETRLVLHEDLDRLDSVRYAPVIFQEYIKGVDLRITIVGEKVFAAAIDARRTSYPVDMRMAVGEATVSPMTLPGEVVSALRRLMDRLGLVYGAIDMRRSDDGAYYFLEVNPAGQWLFVESRTGLPISQAVADSLASLDEAPSPGAGR
jgi:glutathione synthase/RimK-type ligase-like ATP-grasp enzyme